MKAEVVVPCGNLLGESAFWHSKRKRVFWLSILPPSELLIHDPATGSLERHPMPQMITSMRPWGDGLVIAAHRGIHKYDLETRQLIMVADPEPGLPFNRCNDGGTDAKGRYWFGTMQNNVSPGAQDIDLVQASGTLYRLDSDLSVTPFESGIWISNTLCFSPENDRMYFCDTKIGTIWSYDYDLGTGTPSNRRDFARFDRGLPDGSCVDAEGGVWNARWDGSCVVRFGPGGVVDQVVNLPAMRPTSVAFGGEDLDTLYVTSARTGMGDGGPDGHLFAVKPGVKGLPTFEFGAPTRTS